MYKVNPKGNQSWIFIGRTDAETEAPILWPPDGKNWFIGRLWCWERLKLGGEGDDRGWDRWMASPTRWTWVLVGSGSRWWIGRPWLLQSMASQRVRHNWATELTKKTPKSSEVRSIGSKVFVLDHFVLAKLVICRYKKHWVTWNF